MGSLSGRTPWRKDGKNPARKTYPDPPVERARGTCPVCTQPITHLTGWHNHHIVSKTMGGTDRAENRVLMHPNCHRQVHAKGLTVSKPRPVKTAPQVQPGALFQA